jgi:menaquinone-9 beta-reductase
MPYDLIIIGGGLAGSTLGILMARAGASVLILERERQHRDRIRGEGLHPWGVIEARSTGLLDLLVDRCGHETPTLVRYADGLPASTRNLTETTPSHDAMLTWYHPEMQEVLNDLARQAGATMLRSAHVVDVCPGNPPSVVFTHDGETHQLTARLVVGADGRRSKVRSLVGFETRRDPNCLLMAGVLVSGLSTDESVSQIFATSESAWATQFIPLGRGRHRVYFVSGDRQRHTPIGGRTGIASFFGYVLDSGVPGEWLDCLSIDGPLASFEGASWWVEHPCRDGIALIGDAAAAADPCFGSGQGLSLRDARVLSERLLACPDWDEAANTYAREHSVYFHSLHRLEQWMAEAFYSVDPKLQHVREHAGAAYERGDAPDLNGKGPDQPSDDAARMRFLGY